MNKTLILKNIILTALITIGIMYFFIPYRYYNRKSTYFFSNTSMCRIESSSDKEDVGEFIALTDLESNNPIAIFPSGGRSPMAKISDKDDMLVIQLVASRTGSTDTITIDKKTGKFEREAKGTVGRFYSISQKGQCRS